MKIEQDLINGFMAEMVSLGYIIFSCSECNGVLWVEQDLYTDEGVPILHRMSTIELDNCQKCLNAHKEVLQ